MENLEGLRRHLLEYTGLPSDLRCQWVSFKTTLTTINNLQHDRSRQRLTPLPLANGQRIQGLETPHLRAGVTNVLF